ncbi:MAG: winged helix-turn-helix domain-containing protein [Candidatus Omnitrophica bacterium]|nr:winged helix-turn-helix domain-containing protein [Candidatus Omnitrophota bacterium]
MITEIGFTAGDIWHYLDKHGEAYFSKIIKEIDKPRDVVFMSIGWLAREGHVILTKAGKDYKVKLRSKA